MSDDGVDVLAAAADTSSGSDSCYKTTKSAVIVGTILIIGTQISYIPQIRNLIVRRSGFGINPATFLLMCISSLCNLCSGFLTELESVLCCQSVSFGECNKNLLSIYQLATVWANNIIVEMLFVSFFQPNPADSPLKQKLNKNITIYGYILYGITFGIIAPLVIWMDITQDQQMRDNYATVLTVISNIVIFLTWAPQIWETYRLKCVGSLSIIMLCIQCPGSFFVAIFQGILERRGFQVWLPYLASGIQTLILIILCLYYRRQEKLKGYSEEHHSDEKDPLTSINVTGTDIK